MNDIWRAGTYCSKISIIYFYYNSESGDGLSMAWTGEREQYEAATSTRSSQSAQAVQHSAEICCVYTTTCEKAARGQRRAGVLCCHPSWGHH